MPPPRTQTSALLVALGLVLVMLLAGCSGSEGEGTKAEKKPGTDGEGTTAEAAPDPGFGIPEVGDCHRMTGSQSRASVDRTRAVSCRDVHTNVVAHVGYVPTAVTPQTPVAQRRSLGIRICEPAYRKVVGGTLADRATSILTWTLFTPNQAQLERGARWVRCDVVARSGAGLVPLPAGTPLLAKGVPEQLRVCQNDAGTDVSCAQPHAFRVQAVYRAVGAAYPVAPAYTPTARARCAELTGSPGGFWQPPSREGWQAGDRFVRCLLPKKVPTA